MHGRLLRRTKRAAFAAARETPAAGRGVKAVLGLWLGLSGIAVSGCANMKWPADGWPFRAEPAAAASSAPASGPQQAPASASRPEAGPSVTPGGGPNGVLDNEIAMARLCERRGETDDAQQMYCALLKKFPQDPRLHHRLAVLAVQRSSFSEAEEHFRAARSRTPADAELLNDMGYCCYLQGRFKEAEDLFRQALKADANNPAAITMATNNLALAVGAQGRLEESLSLFKRVNSEAEAFANVAYVLAQSGQGARAQQMYLRALTLDNTMRAAAQAMLQVAERSQALADVAATNRQPPAATPAAAPAGVGAPVATGQPAPGAASPPAPVGPAEARTEVPAANRQPPAATPAAAPAVAGTAAPAGRPNPPGSADSSPRSDRPALLAQPETQPPCPPRGILGPTSAQQASYPAATPPAGVQPVEYTQPVRPAEVRTELPAANGQTAPATPAAAPAVFVAPAGQPAAAPQTPLAPVHPAEARTELPAANGQTPPAAPAAAPAVFVAPAGQPAAAPQTPLAPVRPAEARTELPAIDQQQLPGTAIATDADSSTDPRPSIQRVSALEPLRNTTRAPATTLETPGLGVKGQHAIAEGPPLATRTIETPVDVAPPRAEQAPTRPLQPNLALPVPMPWGDAGWVASGLDLARVAHKLVVRFFRPAVGAVCGCLALAGLVVFGRALRHPRKATSPRQPQHRPSPNLPPARVRATISSSMSCGVGVPPVLKKTGVLPTPRSVPPVLKKTGVLPALRNAGAPLAPRNTGVMPAPQDARERPAPKHAREMPAPQAKLGRAVLARLLRCCGWVSWAWKKVTERARVVKPRRRPVANLAAVPARAKTSSSIPCGAGVPAAPKDARKMPAPKTAGQTPAPQAKVGSVVLAWLLKSRAWVSWAWQKVAEKARAVRPRRSPLPNLVSVPVRAKTSSSMPCGAGVPPAPKTAGEAPAPQAKVGGVVLAWLLRSRAWASWAWSKVAEKARAMGPRRRPLPKPAALKPSGWMSWAWRKVTKKLHPETPRRRPLPRQVPLRRCE